MSKTIPMEGIDKIKCRASTDRRCKFSTLVHLMNESNLRICYRNLNQDKTGGIDLVTKREYGLNLDENIKALSERLKDRTYTASPVKRVYIPKHGNKNNLRMLGIPTIEDRIIQRGIKDILISIYEPVFFSCAYGIHNHKDCHDAIRDLHKCITNNDINFIVEVDIRKFFDNVQHGILLSFLRKKISDSAFLWIIRNFLTSGAIEDGVIIDSNGLGMPQGGTASSVLSNVYLHYIIDIWFYQKFRPKCRGYVKLIRYCDDFVACFEHEEEATSFFSKIATRLNRFGLKIAEEKTRLIRFSKKIADSAQFDFLGFTHCICKNGDKVQMVHKTSRDKLLKKLKEADEYIKYAIRRKTKFTQVWMNLRSKVIGHINYFGISGNLNSVKFFRKQIITMVLKWLKREQKTINNECINFIKTNPMPKCRIVHII